MKLCFAIVKIIFLFSVIAFVLPDNVSAEPSEETEIQARHLQYNKAEKTYYLEGNVVIKRLDAVLKADRVVYNEETSLVHAYGNVRYEDKDVTIESDEAEINIETKWGRIFNADVFFKKDNYYIKAEEIERLNEKNYQLKSASFTTCDAPVAAWCFKSSDADIRIGDRIKARHVTFRIKGIPTFYTPYLWAPILTERKSGLLMPEIGFRSDKGIYWRQPLYLVLAQNRDLTFNLDLYSRRGIGEGIEYRYIERNIGEGKIWLYHIKDKKLNEHFVEFKAEHRLFNRDYFSGFLDLNLINKQDFYREYSTEVEVWASRFLESKTEFYYPFRDSRVYLEGRFWQELRDDHETGEISQKIPEIGFTVYPVRKGPVYLSLNSAYSHFYSKDLHRVNRFDIYPRVYHTLGDLVQLSQIIGIRETYYSIYHTDSYKQSISRESFDYSVRLHTRLLKRYSEILHVVEPEIGYKFIPQTNDTPPLLDSVELYNRVSLIYAGIRSYIFDSKGMILSLRLSEDYDFHHGDRPLGWIKLEGAIFRPFNLKFDSSYNPSSGRIETVNYSLSAQIKKISFSLGQRYSKEEDILFYTATLSFPLTSRWSVSNSIWYDMRGEGLKDLATTLSYSSQCWGISVSYRKRPDDYSFMFMVQLKGLGFINLGGYGAGQGLIAPEFIY